MKLAGVSACVRAHVCTGLLANSQQAFECWCVYCGEWLPSRWLLVPLLVLMKLLRPVSVLAKPRAGDVSVKPIGSTPLSRNGLQTVDTKARIHDIGAATDGHLRLRELSKSWSLLLPSNESKDKGKWQVEMGKELLPESWCLEPASNLDLAPWNLTRAHRWGCRLKGVRRPSFKMMGEGS